MYWLLHNRSHSANLFPRLTRDRTLRSDSGTDLAATSGGASVTGGATSVAGGAAPGGADTTPAALAPWDQFAHGLERLHDSLAPRLDALRQDVTKLPDALRPEPPPDPAPDYDSMSQSELATHITGSVLKAVEQTITKALQPVMQRVDETQQSHFKTTVESEMRELSSAHKDFADWKPQMVELAKAHPTLGLRQLYNLARVENAARAKELDAKYNPPAPPPPPRWGGLTPALGSNGSSAKPLSREDASREAYREVASRHPGILAALENL